MVESVEVIIKQPGHPDRVVRLQEGAARLGRAEDNEIVLSDVGVSRRHAQIYVSRGEVTVEDLGSGNGTYYNGYRVQSQPVQNGDEIVIDPFVMKFTITGQEPGLVPQAAGAGEAHARLDVVVGTGLAGSSYPITSRGLSIGRSEDRDVVIPDPASSRHHCQISLQAGEYVLRDMGSANGIFVNAVRVRECTLADGDMIRIGNTEMRFVRYEGQEGDNTTQVVHGDDWQQEWDSRSPPKKSHRGKIIAAVFMFLVVVVSMLLVMVLMLILVFVYLSMQPASVPDYPAQPPRWELVVEPGLPAAKLDDLFEQGSKKMSKGDRRGALQDFYRVLKADPARISYVDNFAFAAGEGLVIEELAVLVHEREAERVAQEAERDRLLKKSTRRGRSGRAATQTLEEKFRADPVVMAHFDWPPPQGAVEVTKKAEQAKELMAAAKPDEALSALQEVLANTRVAEERGAAAGALVEAHTQIALSNQDTWTVAVLSEASGLRMEALAANAALLKAHPAHASARLRQARLQ